MEVTKEQGAGLLNQILPPRLEDAGLEDCALPPDSIKEAFLMAATAVKSRAASILTFDEHEDADGECVKDPWPTAKGQSDVVVGVSPEANSPGPCAVAKGGGTAETGGDEVVVGGADEKEDKVVVGREEMENEGKACVEGLHGLEIGEKKSKNAGADEDEKGEEDDDERPILVGGYV